MVMATTQYRCVRIDNVSGGKTTLYYNIYIFTNHNGYITGNIMPKVSKQIRKGRPSSHNNKDQKVIGMVLAGGRGKRLHPMTERIPKSLVEIKDGYTILDKQLLDFKNAGIDRVVLLTGHLSDKIEERYGSSWKGVDIIYSAESEPLGTWGSIKNAIVQHSLHGPAVIRNGDVVTDFSITEIMKNKQHPVTILGIPMRSQFGILDINGSSIVRFKEKPILPHYISGGIYYVKELDDLMKCSKSLYPTQNSIEYDIFPILASESKLGVHIESDTNVFWASVDSIKDLEEVRKIYRNKTDKPWGYELLISHTDKYLQKKLYIKKDYKTSMHYHERKMETLYVVYGKVRLDLEGDRYEIIEQGESRTIKPGEVHSIVGLENTLIDESSTSHIDDTIRVKDFYTR